MRDAENTPRQQDSEELGETTAQQDSPDAREQRFRDLLEAAPDAILVVDQEGRIQQVNAQTETLFGYTRQELIGRPVETLIPAPLWERHTAHRADFMAAPRVRPMGAGLELAAQRKDGSQFPVEVSLSPLHEGEALAVIAIVRDVTQRKREEAALQAALNRLAALFEGAQQLARGQDLDTLAAEIVGRCVERFDAQLAWLGWIIPGAGVTPFLSAPSDSIYLEHIQAYLDAEEDSPLDEAITTGQPVVIPDLQTEGRFAQKGVQAHLPGSMAVFPLISGQQALGVLVLYSGQRGFFDGDQMDFFQTYANLAAAALKNQRLLEETRRHAVEMEAQVAERTLEFNRFFAVTPDLLAIVKADGTPARINPAWEAVLGFSETELVTHSFQLIHPEDRAATQALIKELAQSGRSVEKFENRLRNAEGEWRTFQWTLSGRPESQDVYIVGRDVTAEKQAERDRALLAAVVESTDVAIVSKSLDGVILSWNRAAERLYGYSAQEAIGQPVSLITPPDRRQDLELLHARVRRGEGIEQVETERVTKDGRRIPVSMTVSPIQDARGEIVGISALTVDLSERIRREQELRRAKIAAEAASQAKSEFLASMSHELRTPLNAILGFSELLQREIPGPLTEKQARYVQHINASGQHLLQLINDILDLAKIEAGRLDLQYEEFDASLAVESALEMVAPLAEEKQLALSVERAQDLPPLKADPSRFKQILLNLMSNAIKFTPPGGEIRVRTRQVDNRFAAGQGLTPRLGDDWLLLTVADTGIGLTQEDRERVFGQFEQIDSTYARQQEGTGLGLALTRRLVEAHGGRIWAESPGLGQGSIFSVLLPFAPPAESEAGGVPTGEAAREASPETEAAPPLLAQATGPLALIIEDDPIAAELLEDYLAEAGYSTAVAYTGQQALAMARQLKPQVITLDILLPQADEGFSVLTELKSDPATASTPVIVVSITEDRERGFALGAVDWLIKPVGRERFVDAVKRVLEQKEGGPEKGAPTILVVDDQPQAVEFLEEALGSAGFQVLCAYGGEEGIALALAQKPDAIILDLTMPEVSGFQVIRRLRARAETAAIPILVYTASELSAEEKAELSAHVQSISLKSEVGREELLALLEGINVSAAS